jgi:hypothetical protein
MNSDVLFFGCAFLFFGLNITCQHCQQIEFIYVMMMKALGFSWTQRNEAGQVLLRAYSFPLNYNIKLTKSSVLFISVDVLSHTVNAQKINKK